MIDILDKIPSNTLSLSQDFHEKTKIAKFAKTIPKKEWPKEWHQVLYKSYPRFEKFKLPKPILNNNIPLLSTFMNRKSSRNFSSKPMTMDQLSSILYYAAGLRRKGLPDAGNRFYPSAGAKYSNEIYPIVLNVKGLNQEIYHYNVRNNLLEKMWGYPDFKNKVFNNFNQKFIEKAAVLLVISSVFWRTQMKYGDRGYRNLMFDTGHLCQNIYLLSSALEIGCCSIGGYLDNDLNKLLDLDGKEESTIIVMALGNTKK